MSTEKKHWIKNKILRRTLKTLGVLLLLLILLPFTLYIPWVQNVVKDYACEYASKKTGLDISIDRILIKFPLDLSVDGVLILDEHKDTMLRAENLTAGVEFKPLLDLNVKIGETRLTNGYIHTVSKDSSSIFTADVKHILLQGADVDLKHHEVNLLNGELTGGKVELLSYPHKKIQEPDTTESTPWRINALQLTLKDIDYAMQMRPGIDDMKCHVGTAHLSNGLVDMEKHTITARSLSVDSADCKYFTMNELDSKRYLEKYPVPPDTLPGDTATWSIQADSIRLTNSHAVYGLRDFVPELMQRDGLRAKTPGQGLNTDFLEVKDANIAISNFSNYGSSISFDIDTLRAKERCGFEIKETKGKFAMNDEKMDVTGLRLKTMHSDLNLDAHIDNAILADGHNGNFNVKTDSKLAIQDLTTLYPEMRQTLKGVPQYNPITLKADLNGNPRHVKIKEFDANVPRYAHANVSGDLYNVLDAKNLSGDVAFDANFQNIDFIKPTLLDKATAKQVNLPPMQAKGKVKFGADNYAGNIAMKMAGGELVGSGSFNGKKEQYNVDATFNNFPVKAILPTIPAENLTAHVKATGNGFDFLKGKANVSADVDLKNVVYNKQRYSDITAAVDMSGGNVSGHVRSNNPNYKVNLTANGSINNDHYVMDMKGNIANVDLKALGLSDSPMGGTGDIDLSLDYNARTKEGDAIVNMNNLRWNLDGNEIVSQNASMSLSAHGGQVKATIDDEDTHLRFESQNGSLENFMASLNSTAKEAKKQIEDRNLNVNTLQEKLPKFNMEVKMGVNGIIPRYLQRYDVDFRDITLRAKNDSTIFVDADVHGLSVGTTLIDTLTFDATQKGRFLTFDAHMGNRPGTMDEFAQVDIHGGAVGSTVDFLIEQKNIQNETGYRLGVNAKLEDQVINARLFPENPVIGYRDWTLNKDNFVKFNYNTNKLEADLNLSNGNSSLALRTEPTDNPYVENILLNINNMKLEDWIKESPYTPAVEGTLNADMKVAFDGHNIEGGGVISVDDLVYNHHKEGNLKLNSNFSVDPSTASTHLDATIESDGEQVAVVSGSLNDETKSDPLNLNVELQRFPLSKVSAFIPGHIISLKGFATANLEVKGTTDKPRINGYVQGDSAFVSLPRYGCSLRLDSQRIPFNNGVIPFKNFKLWGLNNQPINLDGTIDINSMNMDLKLAGNNVQVVGSEQKRYSEVFGKGFADLNATVKSVDGNMSIRANVNVLPTSNLTYVIQESIMPTTNSVDENMVKFINPNDSTESLSNLKTLANTSSSNLQLNIDIQDGAKLGAYLTTDGKDRVTFNGNGRLKYSVDFAGKDNMVGTYHIEEGNVRYTPPVIAQKNFDILSGSTVVWTGDVLNPQLNVSGTQKAKASVSQEDGSSHVVDFLITAKIGNTLNNMDLTFDISAENDMNVQNEIQSMSETQRSNTAINMLLYNTYSGLNTNPQLNLTTNAALYSFLQSQLNGWASSKLSNLGLDVTFGINEFNAISKDGKTSTETSYSYRLSKTLFNDRFKVVVGGAINTNESRENSVSNNLINDLSVEYYLNNNGNMFLRLFHRRGIESIIEGEISKTGVGFVMKRKLASILDLFRKSPQKAIIMPPVQDVDNDTINPQKETPLDSTISSKKQ